MKRLSAFILFAIVMITSCTEAPEFPNTPKIEFKNIIFKDISDGEADSLILFIDFQDGDGDLGLSGEENSPPYNEKNYFSNKTGEFFDFDNETVEDLMVFSNRAIIDTLPTFSGDAKCLHWDTNPDLFLSDGTQLNDTVYFQFNELHYNFLVDWMVDKGSGFEDFDWRLDIDCSTDYNGRFPILNEGKSKSLEGTIKYGMTSFGFKSIFKDNLIKLRIRIIDRAGNYSNAIEIPPFRLSDID